MARRDGRPYGGMFSKANGMLILSVIATTASVIVAILQLANNWPRSSDKLSQLLVATAPPLSAQCQAQPNGTLVGSPAHVDGELFGNSLIGNVSGTPIGTTCVWEFNLGRDWSRFRTVVGISDTSSADGTGDFRIIVDGQPAATQRVGLGLSRIVEIDLRSALRLRLEAELLEGDQVVLVYGDPKLFR